MAARSSATVDDLYRVPDNGKAEIVDGELVRMSPTGARSGRAAGKVFASLNRYEEQFGGGSAFGDNVGFVVDLPNRGSFSPAAAWYAGAVGEDELDFLPGPPAFAMEVRSKNDYGPAAERAIAEKIRDYLAAGTQVDWEVDLLSAEVIRVYRAGDPATPTIYRRGETAEAEPAVPGWRLEVDALFT